MLSDFDPTNVLTEAEEDAMGMTGKHTKLMQLMDLGTSLVPELTDIIIPNANEPTCTGTDKHCAHYYYHPDHLGSGSFVTNDEGIVIQHMQYMPFGSIFVDERLETFSTPYRFTGKEQDCETGLYYYGARYYDPEVGRFMGVDPLADQFGAWNPYHYVHNNPLLLVDPTGMAPEKGGPGDPPMWGHHKVMSIIQGMFDDIFVNRTNILNKVSSNNYVVPAQIQENARKGVRLAKYTGITVGGIITTVVSAGTATGPYVAAFGALTGIYATSAGVSMTVAELNGQPDAAASIPGTPLGVLGRAIDEATNNQSLSVETLADIANGALILGSSDFSKFDALNNADKLGTISGIVDGIFNLAGQSVDPRLTEDYSQQVLDMINSCKESCDGN